MNADAGTVSPGKPQGALGALFRIPIFRRLWLGITASSLGDWLGLLATTALAAYLTRDSSSIMQGAAVSGVLVTRLLPDLILGPVAGALVDRFDRRKVAIICDLTAAGVYLTIAFWQSLTVLLIGQFVVEAVGLFSTPAKQAMWVNIVPRERLAVANQLNYVSIYGMVPVASLVFALLSTVAQFFRSGAAGEGELEAGGLIAGSSSVDAVRIALVINASSFLVAAAIVYFSRRMIPAFVGERSESRSVFSLIREGISYVRHSPVLRALYLGILGAFGAGGLVAGVAQSYVGTLGAGNAGYGILFGSVFTGLALGMLVGPKVLPTMPRRIVFAAAIGAAGALLIMMSLIPDFVGAVITAAAMGLAAGIAWINGFTLIGHEVTDRLRGRVFAFVMSSVRLTLLGTIAAGPILAGAIGWHSVEIGTFTFTMSGPGIVLAVGGLIASLVAIIAAHQVGGLRTGFIQRMLSKRRLLAEHNDRSGALIVVEGADSAATARMVRLVRAHVAAQGFVSDEEFGLDAIPLGEVTLAMALRASADMSARLTGHIEPALASGTVMVVSDYIDSLVVYYGVRGGLDEERLFRLGEWLSRGAWPDLTILVETPDSATGELAELAQAYSDRAATAPERYLRVSPLEADELPVDVADRVMSVVRLRAPAQLPAADDDHPEADESSAPADAAGAELAAATRTVKEDQ